MKVSQRGLLASLRPSCPRCLRPQLPLPAAPQPPSSAAATHSTSFLQQKRQSALPTGVRAEPWPGHMRLRNAASRCMTSAADTPPVAGAAAAASAAAAEQQREPYKFKSAAHRDMVVFSTRLHLQDLLLQRFGRLRTAECRLLCKGSGTPRLLLLWAEQLVQQNPENPPANAFFVPPQLYKLPEVKSLLQKDKELRWLMRRIDPKGKGGPCDTSRDCVPVPHFPSVLQQQLPQFPYEPQQLEFMRDTYGLLKWPFKPVKPAAAAAATDGRAALPAIAEAEATPEGVAAAVAAVAAAVDKGDVRRANSKVVTACSTSAVYAPDETETGAYVWP